jgi:hypothetical protein
MVRAVLIALIAAVGSCATADAAPEGVLGYEAAAEQDPLGALRRGLVVCRTTAAEVEAQGGPLAPEAAEAEARLQGVARRLADLLGRDEFAADPDVRNRLRVDFLYVARPPEAGAREAALRRAEAGVAKLAPAR